mmetsp:Transcript_8489/g.28457  ORF Transcript_8489/g.28457 Transcript_8489/m.28457 type:complete len:99 (-) Transcript_8489:101-397(-)
MTCGKASSSSIPRTLRVSKSLASRIPETIKESPSPRKGGPPLDDFNDSNEMAAPVPQSRGFCPVCNQEVLTSQERTMDAEQLYYHLDCFNNKTETSAQ